MGDTSENYTKRMLAEAIQQRYPEAAIRYVPKNEDPRDYRVNFDKIRDRLGFRITRTVPEGIEEMARLVESGLIPDTEAQAYYNVPPPTYGAKPAVERPAVANQKRRRTARRRRTS